MQDMKIVCHLFEALEECCNDLLEIPLDPLI